MRAFMASHETARHCRAYDITSGATLKLKHLRMQSRMRSQQGLCMHAQRPLCSQHLCMRAAFASRPQSRLTRRMTAAAFNPGPIVVEKARGDHSATCILLHGCAMCRDVLSHSSSMPSE